jgi:pyrimidine operon attenuation protein/uracil phosphoribosyltransferase
MASPSDEDLTKAGSGSGTDQPKVGGPTLVSEFQARAEVLDADGVGRALRRIAHEVLERNDGAQDLVLVGLQRGGVPFAKSLQIAIQQIEGPDCTVPCGVLDVSMFRDDTTIRPFHVAAETNVPVSVDDKIVVLVDDVLYTGRTVRAALDALRDFGRPASIQLAVMVDRGHRELPIRPDFIGKNLPTAKSELVIASLDSVVIGVSCEVGGK